MTGFEWRFRAFLDKQNELHKEDFRVSTRGFAAGHKFPMMVSYTNNDRSYMMNIKGAPSNPNLCCEYSFFEPCEEVTMERLEEYLTLADNIRTELADPSAEGHQYTMIGLVIGTDSISPEVVKRLKKHSKVVRYKEPQTGWSELRICVADLSNGEIYANKDGKTLKNRLENGVQKVERGFFAKLFGLGL